MTQCTALPKKAFIEAFVQAANARKITSGRAPYRCFSFVWRLGDLAVWLKIAGERIVEHAFDPGIDQAWEFSFSAPDDVWTQYFAREQKSPYHHLFGLWARVPTFVVDGDREVVAQNAAFINELMRLARRVWLGDPAIMLAEAARSYEEDLIQGGYHRVRIGDDVCRVYAERSGSGPDLLFLHTAGADSRQFYHLLNNRNLAAQWRMTAFDMPGHGKSFPPPGADCHEYRLTMARYVETILAFIAQTGIERPVVLGCSMAGAICLELVRSHPDKFAGVVACEAADRIPGRLNEWLRHPRIDSAEFAPQWIDGLMAPSTPAQYRHEILWQYSQAGAGIFFGDVAFYSGEFGIAEGDVFQTEVCPVHMLTGEYDYSCTPEMSRSTAAKIPGVKYIEMAGLGHFPMAEEPEKFLTYLNPILDELKSARR